jgi:hypothetical protein
MGGEMRVRALRRPKVALDAVGILLAAILYGAAAAAPMPARSICEGVATSFVFLAVFDILLAVQAWLLYRAKAGFFGRELVEKGATFVYPDFEPHQDVTDALTAAGLPMRYQRPTSQVRALADFWIDAPYSAASNDIEAILQLSVVFGAIGAQPNHVMTDRKLLEDCDRSFISFGLWSSACTYLYCERTGAGKLIELLPEPAGSHARMYVRARDGREFHSTLHHQWGVIVRHAPDRDLQPQRRWFLIGGLGPEGTIGAAWYLARHWRYLADTVPASQDFAAFVRVPTIAPTSVQFTAADVCLAGPAMVRSTGSMVISGISESVARREAEDDRDGRHASTHGS